MEIYDEQYAVAYDEGYFVVYRRSQEAIHGSDTKWVVFGRWLVPPKEWEHLVPLWLVSEQNVVARYEKEAETLLL